MFDNTAAIDEDLVLDAERHYLVVLSCLADRPLHATAANGITWMDWGPSAYVLGRCDG